MILPTKDKEALLATLRENLKSAIAQATPLATETGVLRGERWIVIDTHQRALTQYSEGGVSKIKLQMPPDDLHGVSFFDKKVAERYAEHLKKDEPSFAPFAVWDFQDWQKAQIVGHEAHLKRLSTLDNSSGEAYEDGPSI